MTAAPPRPAAPRTGSLRARRVGLVAALVVAIVALCLLSLAVGANPIPLRLVWTAIVSPTDSDADTVVRTLRMPRTFLGVVVGIALGMAGALIQGHTRNPLADPGLLGVEAGAAFLVVLGISVLGVTNLYGYVWFSFVGAFAASAVVFAVGAAGRGGATPVTLALAGVAISALLGSFTSAMVLSDAATLDAFRFWAVGSLAGRDATIAVDVAPFLAAGVLLGLINAPGLNLLALGEDVARGLGTNLTRVRWTGLAAITLLTGSAVAACGPIAFVGLIVPHVCRAVTGPDQRWLVPASGLAGAVLLLTADVIGRVVVRPGELEVGIVLALVGAPFFVALVRRRRMASL
ncbi:iron complex transport system permease protein [Pseudonocardia sediminis]|uniref:Iron complex transport system permease protein n=1 Tax=Pseudonocardia sediminis TaxID=1397368 RepID=A0A4Q7UVL9_PSEST|nr:iron ABC transporter permease [Pseudonocardia sediminis]RZT85094.1 iron complex transport system permease protein [Pseudonocardia sediminis]